ncbi:MAG TPA: thioredoxin [Acidimicrobiales bacterium]|nr:thioredoxin [Acidimicrobiales bacterium]
MADVVDATFEQAVIERSKTVPVVVDLWAEWCGPCKTLGPILDKVIGATDGKVELAKVDVDANPQVSHAFQVQSIPAVYALKDGKVVDGFVGAQPEHVVQAFVDALLPTEEETEVSRLLKAGDAESLRRVLELEPDNEQAIVGLAELLVSQGDSEGALELLARIPETGETRRVAALARVGGSVPVDDIDSQLSSLLPRVKSDDDARQQFVDLLEVLGPEDPRTSQWRKKLTAALF